MFEIILGCGTRLSQSDLEAARLSYVPCGQVDGTDQPLLKFSSLWGQRRHVTKDSYGKKWNAYTTSGMTGVQIMSGKPTYRSFGKTGYLYYTSIDIEAHMIAAYPAQVARIQQLYEDWVEGVPCMLKTKSGGLRLDAFTEYVGKKMSFKDDDGMLLEILADKCLSRIDSRYSMLKGSLLEMPTLPKKALQDIHRILSEIATVEESDSKPREVVEKSQLGDLDIEWDADGRSQLFPTQYCQKTPHNSNRHEVRFTKHADGSVDGKCFNCGETWWEVEPKAAPTTVTKLIAAAPAVEVREYASFRHFSSEERLVVKDVLSMDPDAGWHGSTPVFTPKYKYLHPLTNKFALNGQPSEVEKRRVWSTLFEKCELCGSVTAKWIDRYQLTAGLYCDGCHKDYLLGSYLELELNRKLPNSIVSEYHGFLSDDPEFQDFRLWQPGMLTHLGGGMSTGKSTATYQSMRELALQGLGKCIIAVPRISLARFLSFQLRKRDRWRSWGLWHEGVHKDEKFIGTYGAIVCLPSLPRAVEEATQDGVSNLYVAIDEIDFAYNLLSLQLDQGVAVKECLRQIFDSTGLVLAGQTESTLALEAFCEELGSEEVQGFYNTAPPADGHVVMHKHPNIEGKTAEVLSGGIDSIREFLFQGYNVYAFCTSRRDGDVVADEFQAYNPVIYNAYTKGETRADNVLRNQKLTDSKLFIGTSAAGVGISILDPNARTVIITGLNHGSRDASMSAQESFRDRYRKGIAYHYVDYDLPLPVRPTENETVSLYHEALDTFSNNSDAGVKKTAHAQALSTLADAQIESFIEYHLSTVGNMPVYHAAALDAAPERIHAISTRRAELLREERQQRILAAIALLESADLLTTSEIRVSSNQGRLAIDDRLAHETANAAAQAVGWDNELHFEDGKVVKHLPSETDLEIAAALAEQNIDAERLSRQRRGYLASHYPKWTEAFNPVDAFRGELITAFRDRLEGVVFDSESLAKAVREVLKSACSTDKPFETEIGLGALGTKEYRRARFLHIADAGGVVDWVRNFLSEWYPAWIAKDDDTYTLQHAKDFMLRLTSFRAWLLCQPGVDSVNVEMQGFTSTDLPDADVELKKVARFRRETGETIKAIADALDIHPNTVSKWCRGIKPPSPTEAEVLSILSDGAVWKKSDIEAHSRYAGQNVRTALRKLLDAGKICKPKRGMYEKKTR